MACELPNGEPMSETNSKSEAPAFVHIANASLHYGEDGEGTIALKDLSLDIARGEFAAVVGPSGCGKSTLMKLISGLTPRSAGHASVDGVDVTRPLKTVGMAFQNPALLPWRTVLENILLPIQIVRPHRSAFRRDRTPFVERAKALLAKVGLAGVEHQYGWQLSGGMQQRVSLCRALIHEPEILLLDEPFGALDAFTREELWDVLQDLWLERSVTILLVTHDLPEAVLLASRVHVISSRPGRVIYTSNIDLDRPRKRDVVYTPRFVEYVHDLRSHIGRAREAA
jgi:NitT/TauT family transport system ATP-binding protein